MKNHILKNLLNAFLISFFIAFNLFAEPETEEAEPELDEDGNPIIQLDMAPKWSLKGAEGVEVGSELLKDKAYVLHFWATWCPYCKELQSGLDYMAIGYVKKGITTYAVSFWENPKAKPIQEMENRGLMLPVLIEGDEVAKAFSVVGTPTTLFIDKTGEIIYRHMQSDPNDPQLRAAYEQLLQSD